MVNIDSFASLSMSSMRPSFALVKYLSSLIVNSQCINPASAISRTYLKYRFVLLSLKPFPHLTKMKNVSTCASPANAARMNAFCNPILVTHGVMP